MGIRNLNRYLRNKCPNSIQCIHMSELKGKSVVIDISIYLYKYETENALLENMYVMLSIFMHYQITPIFIFDGKPPPEKKALLIKRKVDREEAQEEYEILQQQLDNKDGDEEKKEIVDAMNILKRQMVQINKEKIEKVKALIRAYGATYYDAPGEADELCALLVINKKVWACLSEDMDLFVYGCTRVLRYFSLLSHSAVIYSMDGILTDLNMTQTEFKEICVLSGTDYNITTDINNNNLHETLKLFRKFKIINENGLTFYDWLLKHTSYISNLTLLEKIVKMFELNNSRLDAFQNVSIENGPKIQERIEEIMKGVDFIFVKNI